MMHDDEVILNGGVEGANPKPSEIVHRLLDMVESGVSFEGAAKTLGLSDAVKKNKKIKDQFQELLLEASFSPEVARGIVRASRLKILAEAMEHGVSSLAPDGTVVPPDVGMMKIALEANKQIGSDPEVGLSQAPQISVSVNFEKSRDLIDKTEPVLENVEWDDGEEKRTSDDVAVPEGLREGSNSTDSGDPDPGLPELPGPTGEGPVS